MIWQVLVAVIVGGFLALLGVIAGGIFVYRTKRDSHESLFAHKPMVQDGPLNIDPCETDEVDEAEVIHSEQTRRFMEQAGLHEVRFAGEGGKG